MPSVTFPAAVESYLTGYSSAHHDPLRPRPATPLDRDASCTVMQYGSGGLLNGAYTSSSGRPTDPPRHLGRRGCAGARDER